MSAKTWNHVSPVTGIGACQAQSPDKCKFGGADGHFSTKAAERIKNGVPANYKEHEAMRKHQEAIGAKVAEQMVVPKPSAPKPKPMQRPPTPAAPHKSNGFPTAHRRPRAGDEILYHEEIGFPEKFAAPDGRFPLEYSRHALNACLDDRYGKIPQLKFLNTKAMKIIELGVQEGKVSKILYRGTLPCMQCHQDNTPQPNCPHEKRDMCVVVIPKANQPWFVKTVWINLQSDKHQTLDESKYQDPKKVPTR